MLRANLSATVIALCLAGLAGPAAAQPAASAKPAEKWTMPRLADGHPDFQGIWTNKTITPFERPPELANKEFFTADEAKDFVKSTLERSNMDKRSSDVSDVIGAYNAFWWDRGSTLLPTMRTSIVIEPKNGRIPPLTAARAATLAAQAQAMKARCEKPGCAVSNFGTPAPADEPQALDLMTRCISFGTVVPMLPTAYNNNYQIVQSDGVVAINTEMVHQVRRIPTDGSAHLPSNVRQWFGDSRGHWEGDTLVVETTNFKGEHFSRMAPADENLKVTERFTLAPPGILMYRFTVDDPTVWTAPWTGEIPLVPIDGMLYEYACHEGNRGMENILRAARQDIKKAGGK